MKTSNKYRAIQCIAKGIRNCTEREIAQSVSDEEPHIKMKEKYGTDDPVVIFTDKPVEVINEVITNKSISSRSGTRRVGATTPAAFTRGHVERMRALLQVAMNHPWTFASVDSVARSVVAPGWDIVPVPHTIEAQQKYNASV